ncbi:MAG: alpha/beta hydrolase [Myxococcales bacterium]
MNLASAVITLGLLVASPPPAKVAPPSAPSQPWKSTALPKPMAAPEKEGAVEVDGVKLWWASFGAGEPVFLLHGGAGNSEHWGNQIPALAERYRVIVVDARGHGRSTRTEAAYSYHRMAEDLLAVMDALELKQASLVGWSDGGVVGLDLAVHHPERVKKLFAFGANYDLSGMKSGGGPHATFGTYFAKCSSDYQRLSPTPKDYKAFNAALSKMWRSQPNFKPADLARITAATACADGEYDEIIKQDHVRAMAKLIPNGQVVLIPEASHFALWQRPDAFNKAVLDFLADPPAASDKPATEPAAAGKP